MLPLAGVRRTLPIGRHGAGCPRSRDESLESRRLPVTPLREIPRGLGARLDSTGRFTFALQKLGDVLDQGLGVLGLAGGAVFLLGDGGDVTDVIAKTERAIDLGTGQDGRV